MKKKFILVACVAALACSCQQKQMEPKKMDQNDDQNYQERRKQMNQKPQTGGCCESEKPAPVPAPQKVQAEAPKQAQAPAPQQTAAVPEVKVEKVEKAQP